MIFDGTTDFDPYSEENAVSYLESFESLEDVTDVPKSDSGWSDTFKTVLEASGGLISQVVPLINGNNNTDISALQKQQLLQQQQLALVTQNAAKTTSAALQAAAQGGTQAAQNTEKSFVEKNWILILLGGIALYGITR